MNVNGPQNFLPRLTQSNGNSLASTSAAPAAAQDHTFSYNAQDSFILPGDNPITLPVTAQDGLVSTDTVALTPKKAIMFMGQILGMKPDPTYKLNPNSNGEYVYDAKAPLHNGANSFSAVAATVNKVNEQLKEMTGKEISWAFGEQRLGVSPETGEMPNAFYARQMKGVHFFHVTNHKNGLDTSTADSGEAVSHETGHAVLDALRPGFLQGTGPETGAYHEAFGDMTGMLMTLGDDKAVNAIVEGTQGGNLHAGHNVLADCGEGFGHVLGMEHGIRSALNNFVYADPASLPDQGDDTHLGREVHDLSRLWSGTFYDVLGAIADANKAKGMSPQDALKGAGKEGWKLAIGQVLHSANSSETTFKEMGLNMLAADKEFNGGQRQDVIKDILVKRGLMEKETAGQVSFLSFEPGQRLFTGDVQNQTLTFGSESGQLAGVKLNINVDQPAFRSLLGTPQTDVATEATKGAQLLAQDGQILFTDHTPDLGEIFRPDGSAFSAYVAPNSQGQKELHRIPIVF